MQAAEDSPNGTGYNAEGFNQGLSDAFSAVIYDYNNNYTGGGGEEEEGMPCAGLMTFGYFMQAMDDFLDDVDELRGSVLALLTEYPNLQFSVEEIELLLEYYPSIDDDNISDEDTGFHDRTLNCESFNFIPQASGDGQIACVDRLYLSKNIGGVYSFTPAFFLINQSAAHRSI